jgi:hypothetical protein
MTALLAALSIFRDVRPDQPGFQPSWLYVALCLICPAVLGMLSALLITTIARLVGRRSEEGGDA